MYNAICFEIPNRIDKLTKTIEAQQQQITALTEKIAKLEGNS